jgi:hypothetical protein
LADKRHHNRRALTHIGWIGTEAESPLIECRLHDVSQSGAKLSPTGNPQTLPERFNLFLTADCKVGRKCEIVWRNESGVGVAFIGRIDLPPVQRPAENETNKAAEGETLVALTNERSSQH